jgi:hypothetical protein
LRFGSVFQRLGGAELSEEERIINKGLKMLAQMQLKRETRALLQNLRHLILIPLNSVQLKILPEVVVMKLYKTENLSARQGSRSTQPADSPTVSK